MHGEVDRGEAPWPDEAIHPDEVGELIREGKYDGAVRERLADVLGAEVMSLPRQNHADLEHKDYLGDGVYAGWDGLHIVLWLQNTGAHGPDAIALEPEVLAALDRYRDRLKELVG